jgi:outer membrane protein assembly factor BamA
VARAHGVLLALTVACGSHPVHHPGEEFLEAIQFENNHAISSDDLRAGLALRRSLSAGSAPDPYLVTVDRERVKGAYLRRGYFDIDVQSRVERRGDAAIVIFRIDEGVRATTRIHISGLPAEVDEQKVRALLPLHDGEPFSYGPYDDAKQALLAVVQDAGYAHAELDASVIADRAAHEALVDLAYAPGPKCHFGKIDISGASDDLLDAVRARIAIAPGQQFSTAAIAKSQRAIYAMKRFSTVRVMPDKTDGDTIDVRISVAQGARHELGLGGGFGIDPLSYEVRGRSSYSIAGWPFPLTTLDLDGRPALAYQRGTGGYEPRIRANAKLTRIDLFAPFVNGEVETGYDYLAVEAYTSYGPHVRLGVSSPLGYRQLQLRVGWLFEWLNFRALSPLVGPLVAQELGLDQPEQLGEFQQTLALDLRDNPVEPRFGAYAEVRANEGTPYALGAFSFVQLTPEVRGYAPLGGDVVLAARLRVGNFFGDIPVSERYYSGGATTQRGFSERRLSPTLFGFVSNDFTSVPVGGGGLFESNFEVRAQLGTIRGMGVGGVAFLDGGDVKERLSDIDAESVNWAVGGGVRLFTVVGAVRFDVGYRLNHTGPLQPEPNSTYAFHISIGEAY